MADIQYYGTGRRKTSTARVYLRPGAGDVVVNRKPFDRYFPNETLRMIIRQPLQLTETTAKFDVLINVKGGGPAGQAGAIRHGITRALLEFNADLRPALKQAGLVTRDPRIKERKKYAIKKRISDLHRKSAIANRQLLKSIVGARIGCSPKESAMSCGDYIKPVHKKET